MAFQHNAPAPPTEDIGRKQNPQQRLPIWIWAVLVVGGAAMILSNTPSALPRGSTTQSQPTMLPQAQLAAPVPHVVATRPALVKSADAIPVGQESQLLAVKVEMRKPVRLVENIPDAVQVDLIAHEKDQQIARMQMTFLDSLATSGDLNSIRVTGANFLQEAPMEAAKTGNDLVVAGNRLVQAATLQPGRVPDQIVHLLGRWIDGAQILAPNPAQSVYKDAQALLDKAAFLVVQRELQARPEPTALPSALTIVEVKPAPDVLPADQDLPAIDSPTQINQGGKEDEGLLIVPPMVSSGVGIFSTGIVDNITELLLMLQGLPPGDWGYKVDGLYQSLDDAQKAAGIPATELDVDKPLVGDINLLPVPVRMIALWGRQVKLSMPFVAIVQFHRVDRNGKELLGKDGKPYIAWSLHFRMPPFRTGDMIFPGGVIRWLRGS